MRSLNKKIAGLMLSVAVIVAPITASYAAQAPESFADLVDKLNPAVVNISTTQTVEGGANPFGEMFTFNMPEGGEENPQAGDLQEFLKRFYGDNGKNSGDKIERKSTSLGSGFIIDAEGYIVTNNHVIDKADEITVIFSDDKKAIAKVIGRDTKTDLALLKVDTERKLPFVKWGDSDKARVGDWVIAIGNPFGLGGSVSAGIISARARDINSGPFDDYIQTDAAINRGNSGGPLFNTEGEVIGVNSAIFSPSGGNVGIGFAVPTSMVAPVIEQLRATGHVKRGWLGVKIQTVTDDIAESIGMKEAKGALVLDVTPDSPAAKAGLQAGDVIESFDDKDVHMMRKLPRIVAETPVGKKVPIVIWRKEQQKTMVVTVAEMQDEAVAAEGQEKDKPKKEEPVVYEKTIIGLGVGNLNDDLRKKYNIGKDIKGVIILSVDPKGPAADKPLREGDVITTINQETVLSADEAETMVNKAIESKRKSVLMLIRRGEDSLFVAVPLDKK